MNEKIKSVVSALEFNNMMFNNVTQDITDEQAGIVLDGCTNTFNWIVGHIVGSRNYIASLAGAKEDFGHPEYSGGKDHSYDPEKTYLKLSVLMEKWNEQTMVMMNHLSKLTDEDLDAEAPMWFPNEENTIANAIGFMQMHESYHIGQLSLYRKSLGLEWKTG